MRRIFGAFFAIVMLMSATSISISNLSKKYPGAKQFSLKDVSLEVQPGEVYGFLGPNGAGKSTTIRTLLNFIQPTSGQATILDKDIVSAAVEIKKHIGYLSGDFAVYPKMTGEQFLSYMGALQPPVSHKYVKELATRLKAQPSKKMGDLSRGNRQKFGIIQAFMHQPDVLILDEPTSGLDPLMQEQFNELIKEAKDRGCAIFMSSHILSEVQKTCDRLGIIRNGKLVDEQNISDLENKASQTFDITFADKPPLAELKKIPKAKVTSAKGNEVTIHMPKDLQNLFKVLAKHKVVALDARSLDLEDLFLTFYEDKKS